MLISNCTKEGTSGASKTTPTIGAADILAKSMETCLWWQFFPPVNVPHFVTSSTSYRTAGWLQCLTADRKVAGSSPTIARGDFLSPRNSVIE